MKSMDAPHHVRGESLYVDDIPVRRDTLFGAVVGAPCAHGTIEKIVTEEALKMPGVADVLMADAIPGENQIGMVLPDEPLFASRRVHYVGQPVALVLAASEKEAGAAARAISVKVSPRPVVVDPRRAADNEMLHMPPRTFRLGDTAAAWGSCDVIVEGTAQSGGQEHLYIETQGAYAHPKEGGGVKIFSSTQSPTTVQKTVAAVLGLPMHRVEVDVTRMGGGFGGKEAQATAWAAMAALGAHRLGRAVKLVLHRLDDILMTGKRHPYVSDFRIGLTRDLKILAYEADFYQNAGAFADLSPAVLERTLFHAANSYFIPNVTARAFCCCTHLVPSTAFRGFGGPQAMFVMEAAIAKAAETLAIAPWAIQRANLLKDGDIFPYGQKAGPCHAVKCWDTALDRYDFETRLTGIRKFNAKSPLVKKGISCMPVCFGISFTKLHMNQAGALVHLYQDGSVGVSTGATEMGQGVNTKIAQVAARTFSIDPGRIRIESTNTTRVANTSPTAASASADLNGKAVEKACRAILQRLRQCAARHLGALPNGEKPKVEIRGEVVTAKGIDKRLSWEELVMQAYLDRVDLSAHGFHTTPGLHFDPATEKGAPFAYHVYGTAITEVTVDCLRGTYEIDAVRVVHDFGKSMNPLVDLGQVEGGIVQGIGWMTMEEVRWDDEGRLLSNALSTYKVPDIYAAPKEIDVHFLKTSGSPLAILRSKAVGEPPFMYGIGAYFAIRNAMRAFRPEKNLELSAPLTPERVLMALYAGNDE